MKETLRSWLAAAGGRRFWLELAAALAVVLVASAVVTRRAGERAEALGTQRASLEAMVAAADAWRTGFVAPAPAESAAWRRSERRVRERGVRSAERVALAQLVAQRAEELGIPDVAVGFADADTLIPTPVRVVGPWSFEMARYAVTARFTADYPAAVSFVGSLPPQVELRRLELTGTENGVEVSALLTVTRVTGGPDGAG